MNAAFEIGAAALRAEQKAMEILANNVANVNTSTFKRSEVRFAEVMAREAQTLERAETTPTAPTGGGSGVRVAVQDMLLTPGEIRATGNPLDLAIDGQGMIELVGPGGESLFWRGGTLRVSAEGLLSSSDGFPLRAGIVVPDDAETMTIARDGLVSVATSEGEKIEIGQLGLVRFDHADALERLDNGLFSPAAGARLVDAHPGEDGAGTFAQGSAEGSNVTLTQEMVQMLVVQRAFAANAQIIQAADQLAAITNNLKS
jgi:flagellar basal-body rod protein FlgG